MNAILTRYRENQISSTSPQETILMLYDGAIKFLKSAIARLEDNDMPEKAIMIEKTIKIVDHLQSCLDQEKGGSIAENLNRLYDYIQVKLTEANLKNEKEKMCEALHLLQEIREGWGNLCEQTKAGKSRDVFIGNITKTDIQGNDPELEATDVQASRKIAIKA